MFQPKHFPAHQRPEVRPPDQATRSAAREALAEFDAMAKPADACITKITVVRLAIYAWGMTTHQFHARPRDPNFGKDETLSYTFASDELSSLRATFDVRNTGGSIHAYIEGGPTAALYNGLNSIALTSTFNGVVLSATPQEVVDGESAFLGR